jgi:hypothetical protein
MMLELFGETCGNLCDSGLPAESTWISDDRHVDQRRTATWISGIRTHGKVRKLSVVKKKNDSMRLDLTVEK